MLQSLGATWRVGVEMYFPKILALVLTALMPVFSAVAFAQEEKPAEPAPVQQQKVKQKSASQNPTPTKSYSQKLNEARQKAFNPQNKKPTCYRPPRGGTGIIPQTSGHFISHESKMRVNDRDYEKKYKQYMREVQKINEEEKKNIEEKTRQK